MLSANRDIRPNHTSNRNNGYFCCSNEYARRPTCSHHRTTARGYYRTTADSYTYTNRDTIA